MSARIFWVCATVQWNAHVHRLGLGLCSHRKDFGGNRVRTHVNCKEKITSTGKKSPQRRIEPTTLHQAGQQAQHTTNELFRPPVTVPNSSKACCLNLVTWLLAHRSSSSAFPSYISGVHHFGWDVCICDFVFFFYPTIEVVTFCLSGWCMLGVVFFAGMQLSRTRMSGSFELVRWNACVHRLDFRKTFWGMELEPILTPREKSLLPETQRRIEPTTLHYTRQQSQHTIDWAIPAPSS